MYSFKNTYKPLDAVFPRRFLLFYKTKSANRYQFGFNGQLKDNEIYGEGNAYTAEFWEYDPRSIRRWNVDPKGKKYPFLSPYSAFANSPLYFIDREVDTLRVACNQQLTVMADFNDVLGNGVFAEHFYFDAKNNLQLTSAGREVIIAGGTPTATNDQINRATLYSGVLTTINSSELTEIIYYENSSLSAINPETGTYYTNKKGEYVSLPLVSFGNELTVVMEGSSNKQNTIHLSMEDQNEFKDPRSVNLFHGIGHANYPSADQNYQAIRFDNIARAIKGIKKRGYDDDHPLPNSYSPSAPGPTKYGLNKVYDIDVIIKDATKLE